jgi:hypothetical protein
MIPIIVALAAAALGAAVLTLSKVQSWMSRRKVPQGTGEIISEKLATGQFSVVSGVFSPEGTQIARKRWTAKELDNSFREALRKGGGKIIVNY